MTDTVFPINDDVMDEASLRTWAQGISNARAYVREGFEVTDGGGLNADVSAGEAFAGGVHIDRDVATTGVTLSASSTNFVFVTFEPTAADEVIIYVDTDGSGPATPSVLLAEVDTDGSDVTAIRDRRNRVAISGWGDPQ